MYNGLEIHGPNGRHTCLVTELVGPSVSGLVQSGLLRDNGLPARWATSVAQQPLRLLPLHDQGIGHRGGCFYGNLSRNRVNQPIADIHTGNILLKGRDQQLLSEAELLAHNWGIRKC